MSAQRVNTNTIEENVKQICEEIECRLYHFRRNSFGLQVFVDKPNSVISLSDCEKVSRKLKTFLFQQGLLDSLDLEVSSPGVEKFLIYPWHFSEAVGQIIQLKTSSQKKNHFYGVLFSVDEQGVVLKDESQSWSFAFKDIEKANVVFKGSKNKQVHLT